MKDPILSYQNILLHEKPEDGSSSSWWLLLKVHNEENVTEKARVILQGLALRTVFAGVTENPMFCRMKRAGTR